MTDLSALTDRLTSEAGALGLEVNVATHADLLDLVLAEYRRIRQERDNLAGTVELCTAPVEGGDLRDRVRAAGEAARLLVVVAAQRDNLLAEVDRLRAELRKAADILEANSDGRWSGRIAGWRTDALPDRGLDQGDEP